ncbi:MAG: IS91 family transposase, partial [Propionibacteriaceae bacterium]|nr:IS91 family transposase [Propionibacteriaceae bacterium]
RLEAIDAHRLMYHLPKPQPDGRTDLMLTPLELIDRLAALIPPPHTHRHRYHGVLAPNATLRSTVTALAREASNGAQQQRGQENKDTEDTVEALWRSPARYLWAMLLARIYESAPLACPQCGSDMRIIAFVTDGVSVRGILEHIGEPTDPPRITPARGPPAWDGEAEQLPLLDPVVQPDPDFQFDQTVSW